MPRDKYGLPGIYNASPITLPDGRGGALALDSSGRVITSAASGGTAAIADGGTSPLTSMMIGGEYLSTPPTLTNGKSQTLQLDVNGNQKTVEQYAPVAEDNTVGVYKVEQRFTIANVTADTAVKSGAGFLHTVTFAQTDAAPTAGTIILYDNTAESGTIIQTVSFTTTVFQPYTLIYDGNFTTGLYVGFTTTTDVNVTVSYR